MEEESGELSHAEVREKRMKKSERIIEALNALIAEKGFDGIYEEPKAVYHYLREKKADSVLSGAVSYALLSDVGRSGDSFPLSISALSLTEDVSSCLLEIFDALYSDEHISALEEEKRKAFDEFCSSEHTIRISGDADWRSRLHYTLHCSYSFELTFSVFDSRLVEEETKDYLKEKGAVTSEDIALYYKRGLEEAVDDDFGSFCGDGEDYYEPYVEDYDSESGLSVIEDYLEERGLELLSYSFRGDRDDDW